MQGDFLQTGDFQTLALLDDLDEGAGLAQAVVRASVEPRKTTLQLPHFQFAALQVFLIDRSDFQFTTCAGLDALGDFHHAVRIEIQAHNGIVRLRLLRLLLDAQAVALIVDFCHAIALGVVHVVAKHRRFPVLLCIDNALAQQLGEAHAVENVVAEHEAGAVVANELLADNERLCQTVGTGLLGILEMYANLAAVTQQATETREVVRGGDDENLAYARVHESRDGIVNHRLVENRNQLLADAFRNGVEAGSGAAC